MSVELPKDAKGREIPLNTKRLYDSDGVPVSIRAFRYNPNECFWRVERLDGLGTQNTTELILTPPDSIKQLAEDLNRAWDVGNAQEKGCRYMSCYYDKDRGAHCNDCRLNRNGKMNCLDAMMADIISRVNRLAGDSE